MEVRWGEEGGWAVPPKKQKMSAFGHKIDAIQVKTNYNVFLWKIILITPEINIIDYHGRFFSLKKAKRIS